ncbi:hypothetical protein E2R25_07090 [Burkholderia pseudomallei]|nr:hypothetical protein EXY28_07000 [Burkholderia pseudomallei]QBP48105.1 hypothetical protein E2R28_07065 [Burkholderia pseudomallei]QBP68014.1 hypothetical protein E2R25_07090 [Burkholderia pseudomallei]QBR23489.1 hypothetical protein E3O37_07065 [Burkholderia pseudomallei]
MRPPRLSPLASRLSHLAPRTSHLARVRMRATHAPRIAPHRPRARRLAARGSRLGGERRAAVASRPGPPLASLAPAPRLLIAPRLITNRELLLCVLRARFV